LSLLSPSPFPSPLAGEGRERGAYTAANLEVN
jgi:hypothetical protein